MFMSFNFDMNRMAFISYLAGKTSAFAFFVNLTSEVTISLPRVNFWRGCGLNSDGLPLPVIIQLNNGMAGESLHDT